MKGASRRPLCAATFAFLDTETTGLAPARGARVCEIAVMAVCGGRVLGSFASLLNPGCPIDPGAQRIHGITDSMVAGSPSFAEVAARIEGMLAGTVVVCHNAPFDLAFLEAEFLRASRALPALEVVDTLRLARRHFGFASNRLGAIADAYGIEPEGAHRAGADVSTLWRVFERLLSELELRKGVCTVESLLRLCN